MMHFRSFWDLLELAKICEYNYLNRILLWIINIDNIYVYMFESNCDVLN
jgi:hypothetical protein